MKDNKSTHKSRTKKSKQLATANSKCAHLLQKTLSAGTARQSFLILWATVLKESLVQEKTASFLTVENSPSLQGNFHLSKQHPLCDSIEQNLGLSVSDYFLLSQGLKKLCSCRTPLNTCAMSILESQAPKLEFQCNGQIFFHLQKN